MSRDRIVILGGGFAGRSAARVLERDRSLDVTLIDRNNYSTFSPMLPEVASGSVEPRHIAQPLRAALKATKIEVAEVGEVDFDARSVSLENGLVGRPQHVEYDALLIALGAVPSTHGIPGAEQHGLPLKTLHDARALRAHVIGMLETASPSDDAALRQACLQFVVVGGGFTGVEAVGELRSYVHDIIRLYPRIRREDVRVALVAGGNRLLGELPARFGERAARIFARRGIEIVLDDDVASVDRGGLTLKSGKRYESRTVVWGAGVRPSPTVERFALETTKRGAIAVDGDFSVRGRPGVWAIGDCAHAPKPGGGAYPQTAQDAVREGPLAARNIRASLRGRRTKTFAYRRAGTMASLGNREGLADLGPGLMLAGAPAWLLWRAYYLSQLPGAARKVRVALDWTTAFFFRGDIASIR